MTDLSIINLRKTYGSAVALHRVSITLEQGEFVSLLGPSGCGKTTTLRAVAGFVQPDAGEIVIGGNPVTGLPAHRRNIGVVFQSYALFPHMDVTGNVGFGLKMRNLSRSAAGPKIAKALDLVGLGHLAERYPAELSGGQQQRVALARALVIEPGVLLLDEPLSNLDARLRSELRDEIKAVTDRIGMTTLFVTHDQAEALAMSDRVAVMNEGRIVEIGAPEALSEAPGTAFAAMFLGARTVLPGHAQADGFHLSDGVCLPLAAAAGPDPTHAVLRASRLRLADAAPADMAALAVEVRRAVFVGDTRQITVRAGKADIAVHLPADAAAPAPGTRAQLLLPPGALRFIHDREARAAPSTTEIETSKTERADR